VSKFSRTLLILLISSIAGGVAIGPWGVSSASAQTYTQLQVLLPGETADPGSAGGKNGQPAAQTIGVAFEILVRACDSSWNTQSSITSQIEILSSDATATLPATAQMSGGEVRFTVTLNAAGQFDFQARDLTDTTIPDGLSAVVQAVLLQGFEFARITQKNQYAGQPMSIELWAVDPSGQLVTGFDGAVRLRELTSFGEGRIEPATVDLVNGYWSGQVRMYRADETSINRGNVNMYALLDNDPSRNGTSDPFTVHPGTFSRLQLVVPGQTAEPGSVSGVSGSPATQGAGQAFTVDVYATDDYWNPLPSGDTARLISSDPLASTPLTSALVNGFNQFTVSLGTVGSATLTISDQTNGSITGMTSPAIPVIPDAINGFAVDAFATPVQAGDPVTVTIRATDGSGNTVPTYAGEANLAANTGPGSISPDRVLFTNGVWTGQMTFRGAGGAVSFSCSDFSAPPSFGTSTNFVVLPGSFAKMMVRLPGETARGGTATGLSGAPVDQNAGTAFDVTIRAVDEFWNRVPTVNDQVALSSTDAFANFPTGITLLNGEVTVPATLSKAGYQTISAVDTDQTQITGHTSTQVLVLPGTYSRVLILAPGEIIAHGTAEGRAGTPTDQSINFSFAVTVYATDQWWNPVPTITDVVRLTSGDPLAQLASDTALTDGMALLDVRLATGGFQQITVQNVSQPSMPTSTTEVRAISSGFHLEAEISSAQVQAGELFDLTVKVTNDAGSVIQEINTAVTLTVSNAASGDPGRGDLLVAQFQLLQGQRTVPIHYTFAEAILITATDDLNHDPAVTEVITVSPGNPDHIAMSSDPPWVGGGKNAIIHAQVLDAFENGVPIQPVSFTLLTSAFGTLSILDTETTATGIADADYLSPREPGMATIEATSGLLTQQLQIETALVDPQAAGGSITNYPNPFHPGESPTTIAYKLSDNASVKLRIYTMTGGLVFEERFEPMTLGGSVGLNTITWDGKNGDNQTVASGGYIVEVHAEGNGETLHLMRRKVGVVR
jgi:hypothetical protein